MRVCLNYAIFCFCIAWLLGACQQAITNSTNAPLALKVIATPCENGGESNLFVSESGQVYLSWVEYLNDSTDALLFSKLEQEHWSKATEISRGNNWFVNWADFPSLVVYPEHEELLTAHWLQKSTTGTYDYDVHILQSQDKGTTWDSTSFILHRDSIAAEHGFVTLLPLAKDRIFATWLDGRNTKTEGAHPQEDHGHGGAMTLRAAEFDIGGHLFQEAELDAQVCDCCQTDAAITSNGVVVVYRDRSEAEIRDISIVRKIKGEWTVPSTIHADNWKITGCPVNGPSIAANDDFIAVAWYSEANRTPVVKIAFSEDAGATFSKPVRVDDGNPLGRVDVVLLNEKTALVSWLENQDSSAAIQVAKVNKAGKQGASIFLVKSSAERGSGFPIIEKVGDQVLMSWTAVDSSLKRIQTAFLNF